MDDGDDGVLSALEKKIVRKVSVLYEVNFLTVDLRQRLDLFVADHRLSQSV